KWLVRNVGGSKRRECLSFVKSPADFKITKIRRSCVTLLMDEFRVGGQYQSFGEAQEQLANLCVCSAHLKPRDFAEPQFDAVVPCFLHELEPAFEGPVFRDHVVTDGFLHSTLLHG